MNAENQKKLAIDLITNEIINSKLIYGLNALDVDASAYCLFLQGPILNLIGFDENQVPERVIDLYLHLLKDAAKTDVRADNFSSLWQFGKIIYNRLFALLPHKDTKV